MKKKNNKNYWFIISLLFVFFFKKISGRARTHAVRALILFFCLVESFLFFGFFVYCYFFFSCSDPGECPAKELGLAFSETREDLLIFFLFNYLFSVVFVFLYEIKKNKNNSSKRRIDKINNFYFLFNTNKKYIKK